jgi:drug/metabolite transporter (DMT)-like permease
VAEYVFLTRLDWLVQAPVAIVLLKERWTARGLAGGALALSGGILLAWSGSMGSSGMAAALIYILASLVGYSFFKRLSATRGMRGAVALTVWRHWVNTAGFVLLALFVTGLPASWPAGGLLLAAAAGVILVVLFLLRFAALTGIPLWVLAVQAPTQALVAVLVTFATAGTLPALTLAAIVLIVAGEAIVTASRPSQD